MRCLICNDELIIGGNHDYEDYNINDKDGMVTNLSCINEDCDVDLILIYQGFDDT